MGTFSIAIDGPAGAGKSTIAKMVAKQMGFIYVDTGAMYRAFAFYCLENNISIDDEASILKILDKVAITIEYKENEQQVILNGENVSAFIRSNQVSHVASKISVYKCVRLKLVELQRELANKENVVMDGRDIGTYVLRNANLKIYLNANVDVRSTRRWNEQNEKGIPTDINIIKEEIIQRDKRDMNRDFAPLQKADDAVELDTSYLTTDEVTNKIIELFKNKDQ